MTDTQPTLEELEAALTDRQRVFVVEYLVCWNATQAAKRAGYTGSYETLRVTASETLRRPEVQAVIKARIAEKAMVADEVLARLADIARGNMVDFISVNGHTRVDFKKAEALGKLHLIKSYSKNARTGVRIELHDPLKALELLGKAHGLFTDRVDITSGGEPIKVIGLGIDTDKL